MITIRPVNIHDAQFVLTVENDPQTWAYSDSTDAPYTLEEIENFCAFGNDDTQRRYIVEKNDEPIGCIDLYEIEGGKASIAILLYPSSVRGNGYGKEAFYLLEKLCRESLAISELHAVIAPQNTPSVRFFESTGFEISPSESGYTAKKLL